MQRSKLCASLSVDTVFPNMCCAAATYRRLYVNRAPLQYLLKH